MRIRVPVLILLFATAVGCSGADDATQVAAAAEAAPAASPSPETRANASDRAANAARAVPASDTAATTAAHECPPTLTTPAPAEGAPVDDVLGVRPGQTFDEVHALLSCRDGFNVETAERWAVRDTGGFPTRQMIRATNGVPCTSQELMRDSRSMGTPSCVGGYTGSNLRAVRDTTDEMYVAFTGMLNDEVAGGIWRRQVFTDESKPTVANLEQALVTKYGEPSDRSVLGGNNYGMRRGAVMMTWVYDLRGRRVSSSNPLFQQCRSISPSFTSTQRWSGACGLTVHAGVQPNRQNDQLADELRIGVMDQKDFYERGQAFQAAIAAGVEEQRAAAVRDAATVTPDL